MVQQLLLLPLLALPRMPRMLAGRPPLLPDACPAPRRRVVQHGRCCCCGRRRLRLCQAQVQSRGFLGLLCLLRPAGAVLLHPARLLPRLPRLLHSSLLQAAGGRADPGGAAVVAQAAAVAVHGHDDVKIEQAEPGLAPQPLRQRLQQPGGRAGHAVALREGGGAGGGGGGGQSCRMGGGASMP